MDGDSEVNGQGKIDLSKTCVGVPTQQPISSLLFSLPPTEQKES